LLLAGLFVVLNCFPTGDGILAAVNLEVITAAVGQYTDMALSGILMCEPTVSGR
jgi:hypothetical protein